MELASYTPTQITIRPEPQAAEETLDWRAQPLTRRHMADRYRGQEIAGTEAEKAYFGADGPSLGDLVDVINPLHHIPFVSSLYSELTGDTISTAAKLAGGALLGGPIGLIAAVFDTVFTSQTGKGAAESAVAAIMGESEGARVAQAAPVAAHSNEALLAYATGEAGQATQAMAADSYTRHMFEETAQVEILPPERVARAATMNGSQAASDVLSLYGGSVPPAQKAYRDANMLSYLQSASTDIVM